MSFDNPACVELRAKVPQDWEVASLDTVTDFQEGPGILAKDFKEFGVPLLRLRNIESAKVRLAGCNFLDAEKVQSKWKHFGLYQGDFLISTSASLGRVSVVGPEATGAIAYTGIIRFRSRSPKLHHEYLRAFLSSRIFVEQAERMATGSVIKHFGPSHLRQMAITLPPLETQIQIAEMFDVLDDRITLLRETNATLEAIAQALFKSWFVDFDPVRAKMEGRTPAGMDEATAALFPDGFEETELGAVPKGWEVRTLGSFLTPKRGKSITKSKCIEGEIPVVAGGLEPAYFHNTSNVSSPVVTISASGANAGFVRLYQQNIWASDCSFISARETDAIYFWYIFLKINQEKIYFMQQGAAQPHIYPSDLMRLSICLPKANQLQITFNALVANLFERIGLNSAKIQTASSLRDTLLPRLISGQVQLPEVADAN